MTVAIKTENIFSVAGKTFNETLNFDSNEAFTIEEKLPAAMTGVLTTRTSASVGVLTIAAGQVVDPDAGPYDLYWEGGSRLEVFPTGVAGQAITLSAGEGNDLPPQGTTIYAAARVLRGGMSIGFEGEFTPKALFAGSSGGRCTIRLFDASLSTNYVTFQPVAGTFIDWHLKGQRPLPLEVEAVIGRVMMSNGDPTQARDVRIVFAFDSNMIAP